MQMKNGFNFNSAETQVSGGSFKRTNEVLEYGKSFDDFAVYVGANFNYEKGYRDHSESYLENFFSDVVNAFTIKANGVIIPIAMIVPGRAYPVEIRRTTKFMMNVGIIL